MFTLILMCLDLPVISVVLEEKIKAIVILLSFWCIALVLPVTSSNFQRIIGGSPTTIENYPSLVGYLVAHDSVNFILNCGGALLNERTILTAAHCNFSPPERCRIRVGSTYGNSGGIVHNVARTINHPSYIAFEHDIGILHSATYITLSNVVQQATIAGPNYYVPDNTEVWAAGWGLMDYNGGLIKPEQLRHVGLVSISLERCRSFISIVTSNMLCAGSVNNEGGAGQCTADSGSPLYHGNVVVGICSFTLMPCGRADGASVNTRLSSYTNWILENVYSKHTLFLNLS